ncbi:hypothetical protein BGW80DRAFT_306028 [Lactifluus volemus]|nr:hypothetical protein BGW80DRAFT_306028 [Lactifluus volemus]
MNDMAWATHPRSRGPRPHDTLIAPAPAARFQKARPRGPPHETAVFPCDGLGKTKLPPVNWMSLIAS